MDESRCSFSSSVPGASSITLEIVIKYEKCDTWTSQFTSLIYAILRIMCMAHLHLFNLHRLKFRMMCSSLGWQCSCVKLPVPLKKHVYVWLGNSLLSRSATEYFAHCIMPSNYLLSSPGTSGFKKCKAIITEIKMDVLKPYERGV